MDWRSIKDLASVNASCAVCPSIHLKEHDLIVQRQSDKYHATVDASDSSLHQTVCRTSNLDI